MATKQEIRLEVRQKRRALAPSEIESRSEQVLARLSKQELWMKANVVLLYHSLPSEVSTITILNSLSIQKKILLPVVVGEHLELRHYLPNTPLTTGALGVAEPIGDAFIDFDQIDLAIIPGVAFDRHGVRLGYGKGFYDRLLPRLNAPRLGLCFDFQIYTKLPHDDHDAMMNCIVSEHEVILL